MLCPLGQSWFAVGQWSESAPQHPCSTERDATENALEIVNKTGKKPEVNYGGMSSSLHPHQTLPFPPHNTLTSW